MSATAKKARDAAALIMDSDVRRHDLMSAACLASAFILWVTSLSAIDPRQLDDYGLFSIQPAAIWIAIVLLAAGLALSLRDGLPNERLPAAHIGMLVLVLHATPAIAYGTLRYSWAWKHVGVVDFIQRHGGIDPDATLLSAYHNWPGFFVASAGLADLFGLTSLQIADLVRFAPVVFNLLFVLALIPIFRRLSDNPQVVWTATWFFVAGNWVGQDYFSPQALAYFLYLVLIGLCLTYVTAGTSPGNSWFAKLRGFVRRLAVGSGEGLPMKEAERQDRFRATLLALFLIMVIVAIHQFTPLVVISALLGLALIGEISFALVVFALLAEIFWLLYFAQAFVAMQLPDALAEFGETAIDVIDRFVDTASVSDGQAWVSVASRGVCAAIALAALLGGLRRLWSGKRDGVAGVLAVAPIPILAATSYGGEIMFRIYFFALPFLALFAAMFFAPREGGSRNGLGVWAAAAFGVALSVGFVLANNGKDRQYTFSPQEVSAADWLYSNAPPSSILVEASTNYPRQFRNYERFSYVPIMDENDDTQAEFIRDPVGLLARWLDDPQWQGNFVIFTRSQKAYADDMGMMPRGSIDKVEAALRASFQFNLVYENEDVKIFSLNPAARSMGQWAR